MYDKVCERLDCAMSLEQLLARRCIYSTTTNGIVCGTPMLNAPTDARRRRSLEKLKRPQLRPGRDRSRGNGQVIRWLFRELTIAQQSVWCVFVCVCVNDVCR